jgi:hypothetical protein
VRGRRNPLRILIADYFDEKEKVKRIFGILPFYVRYSTLLHLAPFRFHCVGGCWDRIQDCCNVAIDSQTCYKCMNEDQKGKKINTPEIIKC